MSDNIQSIGFRTSEDWTVEAFYRFFHQLNILYNRLYVLEKMRDDGHARKLKQALAGSLSAVRTLHRLKVQSIEIHSPGDVNLLGIDKIIQQLRELWKDISYQQRLEKQQKVEQARHAKVMHQLEETAAIQQLLHTQIKLLRQLGYQDAEIADGIKALADPLEQLVSLAKSHHISLKDPAD